MAVRTIKIDRKFFDLSFDEIHDKLRKKLDLDGYYSDNLDSLYDCLTSSKDHLHFIVHSSILSNGYLKKLYNVIDTASKTNSNITLDFIDMNLSSTTKQIIRRYSCRNFIPNTIYEGKLNNIEACIQNSPTALNKQELNIRQVLNKDVINLISASAMDNMPEESRQRIERRNSSGIFYNAPCLYLISTTEENDYSEMNAGILAQTIVLAATLEELNSCIIALVRYADFTDDKIKSKLRWHKNEKVLLAVVVGHANPNQHGNNRPHLPKKQLMKIN